MIAVVIALRAVAALTVLLLCASPIAAQTEVEKPAAAEKPAETPPAPSTVTALRPAVTSRP